ncbi:hypothetical protein [Luteipulveratus halotolerans]|uniref:ABC3 transporter permease protein domain-containing protein n=1 Tax=Luteipulveratus halotolerans TaxID=1631356 RepID=A0A0L6CMQ2_9MICO|nr:hypothetical protein [Luteipulveratus halotolerans]KNX39009.1 hypothetical protein VV01_20755 [Luteipulveratus halotolerans]
MARGESVIEVAPVTSSAAPPRGRFPYARLAGAARRRQQVVLTAVVAGLVAFAALLPLMTVSIARTMVDNRVQDLGSLGRTIEARAVGVNGLVPPARLAPVVGDQWNGLAGPVVSQLRVVVTPDPPEAQREVTLLSREGECAHLRLTAGRCPTARGEIAVSADSARKTGLQVGRTVKVTQTNAQFQAVRRTLRVAGIFAQPQGDDYWRGLDISTVRTKATQGGGEIEQHTWLTGAATFAGKLPPFPDPANPLPTGDESPSTVGWINVETTVARQLSQGALSYDKLDQARSALATSRGVIPRTGPDTQLTEQVSTIDQAVKGDVDQIQVIAPLLLAQLVLLQVVLVWIVLRALLTGRRSEVALVRLRSPGRRGARRLLLGELAPPIVLAVPFGLLLAYALDALGRATWLGGTAWGGWSWIALGAAVLAAVACAVLLRVMVGRLVRSPVGELLRSVPPRQSRWSLSAAEAVLLTLAVAMLITVATGTLTGGPVLMTPIVMALAAGLVIGGLLVPVGNRVASRLLRRRRLAGLLGLADLARRPSTRNLILAMTAAGALLTFTTATIQLGGHNRQVEAEAQGGAPVRVVGTDISGATPVGGVLEVVDRLDRGREHLAPAVRARSGSSDGPVMLAGEPAAMSRIASHAGQPDPWALLPRTSPPQGLATVSAQWSAPVDGMPSFSGPSLAREDRDYVTAARVPVIPGGGPHAFVTSITPQLAQETRGDSASVEIWSDGKGPALISRAEAELRKAGFPEVTVERTQTQRHQLDRSASAYGLQLGLVVAVGAVLVAMLVMVAVLSAQSVARRRDQSALLRAGVGRGVLGRARRLEIGLTVLPMVLGGLVGWVGARLAAPSVPWYTDDPPYAIADHTPPVLTPLLALVIGLALVAAASALLRRDRSNA